MISILWMWWDPLFGFLCKLASSYVHVPYGPNFIHRAGVLNRTLSIWQFIIFSSEIKNQNFVVVDPLPLLSVSSEILTILMLTLFGLSFNFLFFNVSLSSNTCKEFLISCMFNFWELFLFFRMFFLMVLFLFHGCFIWGS